MRRSLDQFALFVDVERQSGPVERLWLTNGAEDFDLPSVTKNFPGAVKSIGSGTVRYVADGSPVFHQKNACAH
jgi:hypothetical protein